MEDSKRKATQDLGPNPKKLAAKEDSRTNGSASGTAAAVNRRKPAPVEAAKTNDNRPRVTMEGSALHHGKMTPKADKTPKSYLGRASKPITMSDVVDTVMYAPGELLPGVGSHVGKLLVVKIQAKFVVNSNKHLVARQLWGTDKYSDDSDMVAVIKHTGWFNPEDTVPPFHALQVALKIHPPQETYPSVARYGIKSRKWSQLDGWSFSVENVDVMETPGSPTTEQNDRPSRPGSPARISGIERVEGQNSVGEFVPDIYRIQFNLSNEPCLKYSQGLIADRGMEKEKLTSYRLRNEVLYVETQTDRYELTCNPPAPAKGNQNGGVFDTYKFSKVKNPMFLDRAAMARVAVPLKGDQIEVIADHLDWEDVQWGQFILKVKSKEYRLERIQFFKKHPEGDK